MTKTCWAVMLRLKPGLNAFARTMAGPVNLIGLS